MKRLLFSVIPCLNATGCDFLKSMERKGKPLGKLAVLISAAVVASGAAAAEYKYTGGAGTTRWLNDWNAAKDADTGNDMWSSGAAPTSGNDYVIDKNLGWIYFKINSIPFAGGSLKIASPDVTFDANAYYQRLSIPNFTLNAGSRLVTQTVGGYSNWPHGLWLTGTPRIDGTLHFYHRVDLKHSRGGYLSGNLTGQGLIELRGDNKSSPKVAGPNWRITGNNGGFTGKFVFRIAEAVSGGEGFATGVEILTADALGGAMDSFAPDALTIWSWNGLVTVNSDITLNAANRGIDLKSNAFFGVASEKTLTISEPIRSEGGFYKVGAGSLALDSEISFGADGTATPDGTNNLLTVKEGVLRCVSTTATKDLAIVFADGASLVIDPTKGPKGLVCKTLSFKGVLPVTVDFGSAYTAGASETVALFTVPAAVAQTLMDRVDVKAKGASMAGTLVASEPTEGLVTISTTLTVPGETKILTLRTNGVAWGSKLNNQTDKDGYDIWTDHQAAHSDGAYLISYWKWYQFQMGTDNKFNGKSLDITEGAAVDIEVTADSLDIQSLYVDAKNNSQLTLAHTWNVRRSVTGTCWTVNGRLTVQPSPKYKTSCFNLNAPLAGSGEVRFTGTASGWDEGGAPNQGIFADNGAFRGKFLVNLPLTAGKSDAYARGIEIAQGSALGGAVNTWMPDALTLASRNGIVAKETLTLDAVNRGITMQTNAFFEVAAQKTMTVAEPIRSLGGFYKRGEGTLAFGASDVTFGADGTAAADGVNNAFRVAAGAVRPTGRLGLGKLKTTFAEGAAVEIDALEADPAVASDGFYQPLGWTVESGKLNVNVVFPSGYELKRPKTIVFATVPQDMAKALANNIKVNQVGLADRHSVEIAIEPAGEGLAKILVTLHHGGLFMIVK